jgi:hypothetical protein
MRELRVGPDDRSASPAAAKKAKPARKSAADTPKPAAKAAGRRKAGRKNRRGG